MANAPFMDGEKRMTMPTTPTEEEIRQLDFRGLKMFQVLKHDLIKTIAAHIDSSKPVVIKPGQIWYDRETRRNIFVTAHTSEASPIHWVEALPAGNTIQPQTSMLSRSDFEDLVRSGRFHLRMFNGRE